jgi:plastocyanin
VRSAIAPAVAAVVLAQAATSIGGGAVPRADAAECVAHPHSKRVIKHVRRHGRLRKVVRHKHWWSCDPVAAPATVAEPDPSPLPSPTLVPSEPPAPEPTPEPEANRLAVKSVEYYFVLSRAKVKAGALTVELNNQGEDPHNLNLQREGDGGEPLQIAETDSLQRNVATFDLPAGTYRLWCSLPEHEEKGMHTTLVVE